MIDPPFLSVCETCHQHAPLALYRSADQRRQTYVPAALCVPCATRHDLPRWFDERPATAIQRTA